MRAISAKSACFQFNQVYKKYGVDAFSRRDCQFLREKYIASIYVAALICKFGVMGGYYFVDTQPVVGDVEMYVFRDEDDVSPEQHYIEIKEYRLQDNNLIEFICRYLEKKRLQGVSVSCSSSASRRVSA